MPSAKCSRRAWVPGVLAVFVAACTGVPEIRVPAAPGRAPIKAVVILIDTDVMSEAFASYKGSVPFGPRAGDYKGFLSNLLQGLREQARSSGLDAEVETVSLRALRASDQAFPSRGLPVLTIGATSFTRRAELVSGRDLGWSGDTAWGFWLAERSQAAAYQTTWAAGIQFENLNPALCGDYERCSRSLAERLFAQLRQAGLIDKL